MAQEFKEYDRKYYYRRGKTFGELGGTEATESYISAYKSWYDFLPGWSYSVHGREEIRNAVYKVEDAEYWQRFRVGLHDLSTRQKLWCLSEYWLMKRGDYMRKIRIDNYLGALIRGGQLNDNLEVLK